jgi:hypothetical protein
MNDVLGSELECGDKVAYIEPYYRELRIGYVMYVTPKGARIMSGNQWGREVNRSQRHMLLIEKVL